MSGGVKLTFIRCVSSHPVGIRVTPWSSLTLGWWRKQFLATHTLGAFLEMLGYIRVRGLTADQFLFCSTLVVDGKGSVCSLVRNGGHRSPCLEVTVRHKRRK